MKTKAKHAAAQHLPAAQKVRIEFHHDKAQSVHIAGTFNDWRPEVTPMISIGDSKWLKELNLPPGRYEYRLVVDGEWICDPNATECVPNPFGSCNAVLVVSAVSEEGETGRTIP